LASIARIERNLVFSLKEYFLSSFLGIKSDDDFKKTILIFVCFAIAMGSYTLIKELKDFVFVLTVGRKFIPEVKNIAYICMIPLVAFYAILASRVTREWLVIIYSFLYGILGILSIYLIIHPTIGVGNLEASPSRLFGWFFYLFVEGYNPFIISVLWAFLNSISTPDEIKTKYVAMTGASKFGGAVFSAFAWWFSTKCFDVSYGISYVSSCSYILAFSSVGILIVGLIMLYFTFTVKNKVLIGYADRVEGKKGKVHKASSGGFGVSVFFKYPYILGIFGMIFFWEIVNVIFNYMRLGVGLEGSDDMLGFSAFLYKNAFYTHVIGFFMVIVGTASAIKILGERISLVLVPILIGGSIITFLYLDSASYVVAIYVFMRAVHYSFSYPVREALYMPTTSAIRFKTKSWIDSFGSKMAKAIGSIYIKIMQFVPASIFGVINFTFFAVIISLWTIMSFFLGRKWEETIKNNRVIGRD
jgi:ATP:ADP antiporter, AAA family